MKCASVRKALPLFVGGDLEAREAREISAHLARCEGCRATEAGLLESRAWIESVPSPPIEESDFAAIRRGVWRQIEADGNAVGEDRRQGGLALAGGVLAGVLLAAFLLLRAHSHPEISEPAAAAPAPMMVSPAAPFPQAAESFPEPAPRGAIRVVSRARPRPAEPATETGVVRIEFQTANPDVRIIWLAKSGETVPSAAAGRSQEAS